MKPNEKLYFGSKRHKKDSEKVITSASLLEDTRRGAPYTKLRSRTNCLKLKKKTPPQ
jgi:hypothetical protein